ncbi:hypothetical protein [Metapseudomonas furukawaii]|uniref:Uncharacterized protein n=1 Tax=Metapseudomonas furukawaii TaxID=1149133 RepID=L8MI17_METFU|nr:hypothetical protein [Pseudomonas furukawaii]ELS25355.1 hypothetical protein ppKF707_2258 [Pseudomonas furukawaii]ELS27567.1 hypothetical protein ppKF707_4939 [Pseudomonas furukawaii]BAU77440.1 hypothetical protein KF707C_p510 [Pseudomonas furukawaii]
MREAIYPEALELLIKSGTARDFLVRPARQFPGAQRDGWTLAVRQGAYWLPVRSKREPIRVWARLDTLERYANELGITAFTVELSGSEPSTNPSSGRS